MKTRPKPGPKHPRGVTRELVRSLHADGVVPHEIAARLGLTNSTVTYHLRRLHLPVEERFGRRYDWVAIRQAYESGLSMRACIERFGCSRAAWYEAVERGQIELRPVSIALDRLLVSGRRTGRGHLKLRLFKAGLKENRCERCGLTSWNGEPLSMALHHVNGDGEDNRLQNLQLLCPNCHSQTDNYGGRNGGRRKPSASKSELHQANRTPPE